ncbi:MAG: hypothetical protein ACM3XS_10495 [Bacteroidota bacterium]
MPAPPFVSGLETVRIGPLAVSKSFLDALMPLIGALVGGIITYATTVALESRRHQRERLDKLNEDRRAGVAQALTWLDPVADALEAAALSETGTDCLPEGYRIRFRRSFPELICELAEMPLSPLLRVHLPRDCYTALYKAKCDLGRLKRLCLAAQPSLDECLREGARIYQELLMIRSELEEEWRRSFDLDEHEDKRARVASRCSSRGVYTVARNNSLLAADESNRWNT